MLIFWLQVILWIVCGVILGYFFLVWVVARLVTPHMKFWKEPIPKQLSPELQQAIDTLTKEAKSKRDVLEKAYNYIVSKYYGEHSQLLVQLDKAYGDILNKPAGFLPCTGHSFLLRTMLVKSGKFTEDEIKVKTFPYKLFIHQYIDVKIDGQWIHVDPWAHFMGKRIGDRLYMFG